MSLKYKAQKMNQLPIILTKKTATKTVFPQTTMTRSRQPNKHQVRILKPRIPNCRILWR